jgi:hypothetical protein
VRRWEQYTGKTAVLGDDTGQTFEEIDAERLLTANVTSGEAA